MKEVIIREVLEVIENSTPRSWGRFRYVDNAIVRYRQLCIDYPKRKFYIEWYTIWVDE
jgi:hypothetical protein